jgi:hypothetical protein
LSLAKYQAKDVPANRTKKENILQIDRYPFITIRCVDYTYIFSRLFVLWHKNYDINFERNSRFFFLFFFYQSTWNVIHPIWNLIFFFLSHDYKQYKTNINQNFLIIVRLNSILGECLFQQILLIRNSKHILVYLEFSLCLSFILLKEIDNKRKIFSYHPQLFDT